VFGMKLDDVAFWQDVAGRRRCVAARARAEHIPTKPLDSFAIRDRLG
jgi:hypothetical protein